VSSDLVNGQAALRETRERVAREVVGRARELELLLAAVAAGRDILLEGPPGTSKTTMLKAITGQWGIPLVLVEGNAELTPAKLIGHHHPARVLREDYSSENFVPGPLVEALHRGVQPRARGHDQHVADGDWRTHGGCAAGGCDPGKTDVSGRRIDEPVRQRRDH